MIPTPWYLSDERLSWTEGSQHYATIFSAAEGHEGIEVCRFVGRDIERGIATARFIVEQANAAT